MRDEPADQTLEALGQNVRTLRRAQGLTLRDLAAKSGVSERFLSDVEGGRGNVSIGRLVAIARALGTDAPGLLAQGGQVDNPRLEALSGALSRLGTGELEEVERWVRARFGERSQRTVLALLGLRGAGKSTLGTAAAERLGWTFIELDAMVESEAGMSLGELFALHGEAYYRRLELQVLHDVLERNRRAVLATGGGIVQSAEAFHLLDSRTITVWLKARPDEHWDRVVKQGDIRPMRGRQQARAELESLLEAREPLYARAHHTVDTSVLGIEGALERLAQLAGER